MKAKEFIINVAKGAAIGIAMIIPGVSGGTLAVMLKIYDKIIESISGLRKHFRESILFLLPILLGAVLAFAAAYFPLTLALEHAPFPTMLLFAGLMAGSLPKLFKDCRTEGFRKIDVAFMLIPFALVIGLCFIPGMGDVDLSENMPWFQYILVPVIGVLASCALVVPGISGSMLLMIFGYYAPVLGLFKDVFATPLHAITVLACFALGVVIGFFTIAKIMQLLLKHFPRATGWAIFGFVVGSIPAIVIAFFSEYGSDYLDAISITVAIVLFIAGAIGTYLLTAYAERKFAENAQTEESPDPSHENQI